jgi:hypothetical protein
VHWDASSDPETYDRRNWSVDRLHPNERGHRLIACRFWDRLAAAGHEVAGRPAAEPSGPGPTRRDDLVWLATKGTSWCVRRSVDLIPYLLFTAAREAMTEPRQWVSELPATLPATPPATPLGTAGLAGRARSGAGKAGAAG